MNRMDYGRSVVTVRVLEKRLLTKNKLERMIEAETPDEVLKLLGETEYSQNMTDIDNSRDYEKILKRETERVFSLVRDMSKDSEIVDILSLKYDYHNLKVLLRGRMAGKDFSNLLIDAGTVKAGRMKSGANLKARDDKLKAKQEAIDKVILRLKEKLVNMSEREYLDYISKNIDVSSFNQNKKLIVKKEYVNKVKERFPNIKVEENEFVNSGFIIEENGIQENYTFEVKLDFMRDELEVEISKLLFS